MELFLTKISISTVLVLGVCFLSMKGLIKFFELKQFVDLPDNRKFHKHPTPTSGGIIFLIPLMFGLILSSFGLFEIYVSLAFISLSVLGFLDDRFDLSSKVKFILQFAVAISHVLLFGGLNFFENILGLSFIQSSIITVIFIVGIINAFNLVDGSDGISGLFALLIFIVFTIYALYFGDTIVATFSILIVSALFIFLRFNWNPAKIFMGDTGTLALGFAIAAFGIRLSNASSQESFPFEILFLPLITLPVFDTLRVMFWRLRLRKSPFKADRTHFHHLLQFLKLKPKSIAIVYTILAFVLMIISLFIFTLQPFVIYSLTMVLFTASMIFVVLLLLIKMKQQTLLKRNKERMTALAGNNKLLNKSFAK